MLKPRKKMTRKEIKQDRFVETAMMTRAYVEENYKTVFSITGVIFGVILLIIVWTFLHSRSKEASASLLGQAQLEYQNMNYSKSKELLTRLLDEYSSTDAVDQANFLMANLYFQDNKITEAKNYFEEFLDSYTGSEILLSSGYAGLAACLERENNYREAAAFYKRAQEKAPDFVEAANYLYLAGRNFIRAGQLDKAQEVFNLLVKQYEKSSRKKDAQAQLIFLASK